MNNSSVGGRSLDVTPNIVLLFTSNRASPKKELFLPLTETYSFHDNCYAVRYVRTLDMTPLTLFLTIRSNQSGMCLHLRVVKKRGRRRRFFFFYQ